MPVSQLDQWSHTKSCKNKGININNVFLQYLK